MNIKDFKKILMNYALNLKNRKIFYGHIYFHDCEPLLAGLEYFKKIIKIEGEIYKKIGIKFKNYIVTNGTLINKKWAEFFLKTNFMVYISIDGFKDHHDYFRVFSDGSGSYLKTIDGYKILKEVGVPMGVSSTLTKINCRDVYKIGEFFAIDGIKLISFAFLLPDEKTKKYLPSADEHISVFKQLITLNKKFKNIVIYPLKTLINAMKGWFDCRFSGKPISYGIDINGNLYACHRSRDDEFLIGNYIEGWFDSDKFKKLMFRPTYLKTVGECKNCSVKNYCNGGCAYSAYTRYKNIFRKDPLCEIYKKAFLYLDTLTGGTLF